MTVDGKREWGKVVEFKGKKTHERFQRTMTPLAVAALEAQKQRGAA